MQTILGASGQIGSELAKALKQQFTDDIRLVSRRPQKVHSTDTLFSADILNADQTRAAVKGSKIVYFTAGLPMDSALWKRNWPVMMRNVIDACAEHHAKLVYFDNTYMYPQKAAPQTENCAFAPNGTKGQVRAQIVNQLLQAMQQQKVEAMVCRAPEFYGPGKTQSITNVLVLDKLKAGDKAKVFLRDDTKRTLIYTPDASRAMALLGNTDDAYQQTWHLPCDDNRLTYKEFIQLAGEILKQDCHYNVLKQWQINLAACFNAQVRETKELLPRYAVDNVFVSDKFKRCFPDFTPTTYRQGLEKILLEN